MSVTLYRFFPAWGHGCVSQFVLKIDTYLRMAEIPFKTASIGLGFKEHAPKGKLPFIEHDGNKIADSTFIIDYLKSAFGDKLDAHMSAADKAHAHAVRRMLEDGLYWVMSYERWHAPEEPYYNTKGYPEIPGFLGVPREAYDGYAAGQKEGLKGQGIGLHEAEEVSAIGYRDLDALEGVLGSAPYFGGDNPNSLDATTYGFLAHILRPAYKSALKAHADKKRNLVDYVERMRERYFQVDPTSTERDINAPKS